MFLGAMTDLPRPQIFLVDGYALIYRAFFAMITRPLTTSRGENTSAAWGVANFLLRIREEYKPEYVVWVNDAGSSFRTETYPEYKATREKLDDELQETFQLSVQRIEQLLAAFGVPLVTVDGYEADDVIGTLATRAGESNVHAVIVSGDKDFYQLISPTVSVFNPGRGGVAAVQEEVVTTQNASKRLGVEPERVIDYLALVGDSSDNVPGVKGIGDKTARALIEQYGDLDAILAHAEAVKSKRAREALLAEGDNARLSRELVTILRDVDVAWDADAFKAREPDAPALQEIFTELEFNTLIEKIGGDAPAPVTVEQHFETVGDVSQLAGMVEQVRQAGIIGIHAEGGTPDTHGCELAGVTLGIGDGRAWYLPVGEGPMTPTLMDPGKGSSLPRLSDPAMRAVAEILEDPEIKKAGHDTKRDALLLRHAGVELRGVQFDSLIASFLLDPGKRSHELDVLAREHLGLQIRSYTGVTGKGKSYRPFADVPVTEAEEYCCALVDVVLRLEERYRPQLEQTGLDALLRDVELPLVPVLVDMEWKGITLDTDKLAELSKAFRSQLQDLEKSIYEEAGTEFNINSTPQLRHILFDKLQLPIIKRTKTGPSTDAEVLAQLADTGFAVPRLLLEYRELTKLVSTYVDALPRSVSPDTGRIHTTFHQTGAATGRLSSSDPNLQNIPVRTQRGGEIRRCFVPGEGLIFVVADYSQVELRLLAHLSDDQAFISAFQRGGDIHRETAAIIFDVSVDDVTAEMRARAKTINFATIYGQGPFALARQLNIAHDEAKEFIARYFERFSGVRAFLDDTIAGAKERGYVETHFGRRRYIPELKDRNFNVRSFGERTAMNSPIQGSAADLIKMAMANLHARLAEGGFSASLLLQVHDELVLEAPPDEADEVVRILRTEMEGAAELKVPLTVDIGLGPNWLDAKA